MQWHDRGKVGLHLETAHLHRVRWAGHHRRTIFWVGPNHARRPYLTVHYAPAARLDSPYHLGHFASHTELSIRNEADGTFVCPMVIPTESSAESVRAFNRHNVDIVVRRSLLALLVVIQRPHHKDFLSDMEPTPQL